MFTCPLCLVTLLDTGIVVTKACCPGCTDAVCYLCFKQWQNASRLYECLCGVCSNQVLWRKELVKDWKPMLVYTRFTNPAVQFNSLMKLDVIDVHSVHTYASMLDIMSLQQMLAVAERGIQENRHHQDNTKEEEDSLLSELLFPSSSPNNKRKATTSTAPLSTSIPAPLPLPESTPSPTFEKAEEEDEDTEHEVWAPPSPLCCVKKQKL